MTKKKNLSRGFTLIELLVVISIISLLSSIALASLSVARSKGRDAVRLRHLRELQKAVELYYSANNQYPAVVTDISSTVTSPVPAECWDCNSYTNDSGKLNAALSPYLRSRPSDPRDNASGVQPASADPNAGYWYLSNGRDYKIIISTFENQSSIPNSLAGGVTGGTAIAGTVASSITSQAWLIGAPEP